MILQRDEHPKLNIWTGTQREGGSVSLALQYVMLRGNKKNILKFSLLSQPAPHWFRNVFLIPTLDRGSWGFPSSGLFTDFPLGFVDFQFFVFSPEACLQPEQLLLQSHVQNQLVQFIQYMPLFQGILFYLSVYSSTSVRPAFPFMLCN